MSVRRIRRSSPAFVVAMIALFVALGGTAGAVAAVSIRPPAGTPDPKQMVLTASDLGSGATVTTQHYYKDEDFPSVISYEREFEGGAVGRTELIDVSSEAEIGTSAQSTASSLSTFKQLFASKQSRALLKKSFADEFPSGGLISNLQIGQPRSLGVGPGSFDLLMSVRLFGLRTELHISVFRVERILGALVVVGTPGGRVPRTVMTRLAKIMAGRMSAELAPKSTVPPTISGTPQVGQTLTASPGTWSGSPSTFTYQWQRCDPAGLNCSGISGATSQSYLVVDADVGSTIGVTVTAQGALGTATAMSAPTAVVPAPGAPVNTSAPTISGTAQVGQTLTAGTGTWTGSPTSFAFQWQRCNASGTSCVGIPGANSGTYVLEAAEVGSTIRVAVTARNSVGEATAFSAPTAVVT